MHSRTGSLEDAAANTEGIGMFAAGAFCRCLMENV
jgi:hypothetical protein